MQQYDMTEEDGVEVQADQSGIEQEYDEFESYAQSSGEKFRPQLDGSMEVQVGDEYSSYADVKATHRCADQLNVEEYSTTVLLRESQFPQAEKYMLTLFRELHETLRFC